jgi:uncharacterized membrane protein YkvA (DUF1232 family)
MNKGSWKKWADSLKSNTHALYLAGRDPRVPLVAKIIIGLVIAYALSPIDIIPDFIPVIGYLDDLLLVPLGVLLAVRMIPKPVWRECQARAARSEFKKPRKIGAAVVIIIIWLLAITGFTVWLLWMVGIIGRSSQ